MGDVRREGEIWVIDINAHGDKRLKTESSARLVPIHPQLIGLGWLDYVEFWAGAPVSGRATVLHGVFRIALSEVIWNEGQIVPLLAR